MVLVVLIRILVGVAAKLHHIFKFAGLSCLFVVVDPECLPSLCLNPHKFQLHSGICANFIQCSGFYPLMFVIFSGPLLLCFRFAGGGLGDAAAETWAAGCQGPLKSESWELSELVGGLEQLFVFFSIFFIVLDVFFHVSMQLEIIIPTGYVSEG